ncbi:hypothetical protein FM110_02175 [Brachybacterium nesterenkovii]|uniref:Uncharacterized protein n=1 Tax=Brachybacterium nesterenkovii TaxID=47847 RepID=A0A1X6WUD1_9MICO|nr:hypothetical protein FM110_02175 [Brachybacterium nesterenkovii]
MFPPTVFGAAAIRPARSELGDHRYAHARAAARRLAAADLVLSEEEIANLGEVSTP